MFKLELKKWMENLDVTRDFDSSPTRPNISRMRSANVDPAIHNTTDFLQKIHKDLINVFGQVRSKPFFRSQLTQSAFERELTKGVDSVGRAHTILKPSSIGVRD